MANVIENIIRTRDESTPTLRNVRNELAGMVTSLTGLQFTLAGVATAMIGLGAAGFKAATDLAKTVEQLDRISARTGVGIETLQVYRRILQEAGSSPESLTQALTFLSRAVATNDPMLERLGIHTKDVGQAFRELITILGAATDEAHRNEVGLHLLGRGAGDVVGQASALSGGFDSMNASLRESSLLITEQMAPSLRTLDSEMDQLDRNWKGFWNSMASAVVGPVNFILGAMNKLIAAFRNSGSFLGSVPMMFQPGFNAGGGGAAPGNAAAANAALANAANKATVGLEGLAAALRGASAGETFGLRMPGAFMPGVSGPVEADAPRASEATHQLLGDWRSFISEMMSATAVLDGFLNATLNGLTAGFTRVFVGLLEGAQTFKSALVSIFRAMVGEILAQLARLAALKVFSFLFGPIAGAVIGAGAGAVSGGGGGGARVVDAGSSARRAGTVVVNISTIDSRSFSDQMHSRLGLFNVIDGRSALGAEV